ncbi:hypothetical protein XENTR_v10014613 [Xenopus tropicalis]|uniref:P2Y purinoceptor 14 n=1 Tax=Xenopus tropicalis TaxID=8364 RepID=A0A803K3W5_XENTR|nr:P2Y purinoceptor 14 [Xenopus tropicalis]KAE8604200.1 hypothetical protein XENTR_v10014613 [Xenopus tropicalis]|eukprot:XP_002941150.1 PREDICTED: P2Y purinoceptor 14 [Xenopus tropicalis]
MYHFKNSTENTSHCVFNSVITSRVLPVFYSLVFIVSIILNGLNFWIFFYVPSNRSFIVYLKNIVFADLLMTLTLPLKIVSDVELGSALLNIIVCRYTAVIFYLNMYIGIIFLGILGLDRYQKVVRPMHTSSVQNVGYSKALSAVVWMFMAVVSVPNMILTNQPFHAANYTNCARLKSHLGIQWHQASNYICVSVFVVVFFLLVIFYVSISRTIYKSNQRFKNGSNMKAKSSRNIYSILFVFFVCFVPYHALRIPYTLSQVGADYSCSSKTILYSMKEVTLLLAASNVCLDPIIYFFMCQPFRNMLFKKLHLTCGEMEQDKTCRVSSTMPGISM